MPALGAADKMLARLLLAFCLVRCLWRPLHPFPSWALCGPWVASTVEPESGFTCLLFTDLFQKLLLGYWKAQP